MPWVVKHEEPDLEVLEESALFMAQATIQNAINEAGLSRAELAKKMNCQRSFVSRMMTGKHNLTVRTMARAILACGFEVGFSRSPIVWNWMSNQCPTVSEEPATAGTLPTAAYAVAGRVPTVSTWLG
jgi:transcriptional regulator with XRE-family HTH domain